MVCLFGPRLGTVSHQTTPVDLLLAGSHREQICLHILDQPGLPPVLDYPWLQRHNLHFNWETRVIPALGLTCQLSFQIPPNPSESWMTPKMRCPTWRGSRRSIMTSGRARATSLPPYRSSDYSIDLPPGMSPPKGQLYPLSGPEQELMDSYIQH